MQNNYPKISIITPSYNQGQFIEETILSVIGQGYPNLEYIIIDGGSTDNTVEIIKKHEQHITYWISEKDKGQSDAINKGFKRATGDVLAWLNSDDYYMPGVLNAVALLTDINKTQLVYGNSFHFYEGKSKSWGSDVIKYNKEKDIRIAHNVVQPSTFWTRKTWETVGELDTDLHFVFDWEWFARTKKYNIEYIGTQKYLSAFRFHGNNKTTTGKEKRTKEILDVYKRHKGEVFAKYVAKIVEEYNNIWLTKWYINRYKLNRFEDKIIKLKYSKLTKQYGYKVFINVMEMF